MLPKFLLLAKARPGTRALPVIQAIPAILEPAARVCTLLNGSGTAATLTIIFAKNMLAATVGLVVQIVLLTTALPEQRVIQAGLLQA